MGGKNESLDPEGLGVTLKPHATSKPARGRLYKLAICTLGLPLYAIFSSPYLRGYVGFGMSQANPQVDDFTCEQYTPISPNKHSKLLDNLEALFASPDFKLTAYESLGGAVRIPTQTYDDYKPPGEDPRWEVLGQLHEYLEARFPLVHSTLSLEKVNTYALVYQWKGTNEALKPILLTAHQGKFIHCMYVVPVEPLTIEKWVHPPFSGYYDGEWIWGRGSCDDKSGLIGTLIAAETLLEQGFKPSRSIVLAYGIDEERGGVSGATAIRDYLLSTYGSNAFSLLVDEGGEYKDQNGTIFSSPAIAEKGKMDVLVEVLTSGGHSSIPPPHTSIGILASLITSLEANPTVPRLNRTSTYYKQLQCYAEHDSSLPTDIRALIKESRTKDWALKQLEAVLAVKEGRRFGALAGTTQAADVIKGGVKTNALPEHASVVVNHRIADYSSVEELKAHFSGVIAPEAAKFNLTCDPFGQGDVEASPAGHIRLSDAFGTALQPAPVTPMNGGAYELMSGTILATFATSPRHDFKNPVVVSPGLSLGNTDTRHYWNLTKHIYRYGHQDPRDCYNGAHTINEAKRGEGFLEMIRFYSRLILNADETDLVD